VNAIHPWEPIHVMLHCRPVSVVDGDQIRIDGFELATVELSPQQQTEPFSISFETAEQRSCRLPRMFFEPDGSFVWVSANGTEPAWQLDGVVNDRVGRVVSVEIRGTCLRAAFEQMLGIFDWPETPLLIQLVQTAVFLEVGDFFRLVDRPRSE
jgi:hypothetical protein